MPNDVTATVSIGPDNVVTLVFGDKRYEAPLQHSPLMREIVERLDGFINRSPTGVGAYEKEDLRLIGKVLFQVLFGGNAVKVSDDTPAKVTRTPLEVTLGELLAQRLGQFERDVAERRCDSLRLTLILDDATHTLATYPWEFLYVERPLNQGFFLGERALLTRALHPAAISGHKADRLSVWVAWARPSELGEISDPEDLVARVKAKFDPAAIDLQTIAEARWEDLAGRLERDTPEILHIIAHGKLSGDESQLAFRRTAEQMRVAREAAGPQPRDKLPEADWVNITTVADQLKKRPPRLVFLHACNLGRPAFGVESFKGAAESIARANVPFVIAMQYQIAVSEAELFATTFYERIARGALVDDAVRAGRVELGRKTPEWAHRRFATPVVYLHDESARLITPRAEQAAAPVPMPQDCPFANCKSLTQKIRLGLKNCGCERRELYITCPNGHANEPGHVGECVVLGCSAVFEPPVAPAAPPARVSSIGLGEA